MDNQNPQNLQNPQNPQTPQNQQTQQIPQNPQIPQYPQIQQNSQNSQSGVSKGELFVGMNILSKIGVIFIIIGVIAFSATSEGYLPDWTRMGMVVAIGIIMLVGGEIFRKKGSVVFANALTFGGIIETFVCTLIGRFGFNIWGGTVAQVVGLAAAAIGIFLALRYKSQPLLIITQVCTILPIIAAEDGWFSVVAGAVCLMAAHAVTAFVARKKDYQISTIFGVCLGAVHAIMVRAQFANLTGMDEILDEIPYFGESASVFALIFLLCVTVCYAGGVMLNAAESGGCMFTPEITSLCLSLSFMLLLMNVFLSDAADTGVVVGIADVVYAVILGVIAVCFGLRFNSRCVTVNALLNIILSALVISVPMLLNFSDVAVYIGFHVLASAVLIMGIFTDRKLFTYWGYVLICVAEIAFLIAIEESGIGMIATIEESGIGRVVAIITNIVLWFAIMALYIVRKKHETVGFHVYACAAFLNAGVLLSSLVNNDLYDAMLDADFRKAECRLLCTLICACIWLVLGFGIGKPKFLKTLGMVFSIGFYSVGMIFLFASNVLNGMANYNEVKFGALFVFITIIVNLVSVLTVLDLTIQITAKAPKFAKAIGLVVSGYALASLTAVLGMNNMVAFTSWIISIIYIVMAAVWIVIGFKKRNALLRRFGLALALLSSAKLFLFDFRGIDAMARTLLFIGFGVTLLGISFGYGIAEKKLKEQSGDK